jgi:hypothetical protein
LNLFRVRVPARRIDVRSGVDLLGWGCGRHRFTSILLGMQT